MADAPVYRDLSLSLAAHVALIAALLALSAARQPVRIPDIVRPVRLVTTLDVPRSGAAPPRAARPIAPPATSTPHVAERAPTPPRGAPAPRTTAAPVKTVQPIAIPRIVIPTAAPNPPEATQAAARPRERDTALRERLARRLSAQPGATRPEQSSAAPQIARLRTEAPAVASPEAAAALPSGGLPRAGGPAPPLPSSAAAVAATAATTPAPGAVQPVGYFPHAWYLAVLKERIFTRWAPPSEFYVGRGLVAALVSFRIDRAGRISGAAVKESSGHVRFDRSALAAIQGLGQVPPLPEQYAEETLDVVIRFQNE